MELTGTTTVLKSGPHASNATGVSRMAPTIEIHVVNVLVTLEKVIDKILDLPKASKSDEISMFAQHVPINLAKEDAWEYLDPMLNRFLGFGQTTESISNKLWGGERGLTAMVQYLKEFVGWYQIDAGLLQEKIEQLVNVIRTW